jgi:hypothetical protein
MQKLSKGQPSLPSRIVFEGFHIPEAWPFDALPGENLDIFGDAVSSS